MAMHMLIHSSSWVSLQGQREFTKVANPCLSEHQIFNVLQYDVQQWNNFL